MNQKESIEQACGKLMVQFANYNDALRYDELAELFTEEASFARPTDPENFTVGRSNILAAFQARPKDKVTRHIISNVEVTVLSETAARGRCYATLYMSNVDKPAEKFGLQANAAQFIGEFYDDFVLTDEGWRIHKRSGKIIFTT